MMILYWLCVVPPPGPCYAFTAPCWAACCVKLVTAAAAHRMASQSLQQLPVFTLLYSCWWRDLPGSGNTRWGRSLWSRVSKHRRSDSSICVFNDNLKIYFNFRKYWSFSVKVWQLFLPYYLQGFFKVLNPLRAYTFWCFLNISEEHSEHQPRKIIVK